MDNAALAALVRADLELIIDRTRAAYLDRVPVMRRLPVANVAAVVTATRRTMELFCRYYVEGSLDARSWNAVRDATVDRAGELFDEDEILEILDAARSIGVELVRELWHGHPELTYAERAKVVSAIERYVAEIAEQEDRLRMAPTASIERVLALLEAEGADLR